MTLDECVQHQNGQQLRYLNVIDAFIVGIEPPINHRGVENPVKGRVNIAIPVANMSHTCEACSGTGKIFRDGFTYLQVDPEQLNLK